jgi:hypothetical protein
LEEHFFTIQDHVLTILTGLGGTAGVYELVALPQSFIGDCGIQSDQFLCVDDGVLREVAHDFIQIGEELVERVLVAASVAVEDVL